MTSEQFPPIWVISLVRAGERRRAVADSLAACGLQFEFLDAVDGSALSDQQRARYSRPRALFSIGRGLGWGEIGCALSHLAAYDRLIDSGRSHGIVMEDDVLATADFAPVVLEVLERPRDWDVITFHSLFGQAEPVSIGEPPFCGGYRMSRYGRVPFGAQCYLITTGAARRLREVAYPLRYPADDLVFRHHPAHLRVLGVEPQVVRTQAVPSELVARETAGERPDPRALERPVVWSGKLWQRAHRWSRLRCDPSER